MDRLLCASQLLREEEDYLTSEVGVDMDLAFALRLCPVFTNRLLSLAFSTVDCPLPCFALKTTSLQHRPSNSESSQLSEFDQSLVDTSTDHVLLSVSLSTTKVKQILVEMPRERLSRDSREQG